MFQRKHFAARHFAYPANKAVSNGPLERALWLPMPNVKDLMTADPMTLDPGSTVFDALRLMDQVIVRHLPVVREGELVGMLSDRDLRNHERTRWVEDTNPQTVMEYFNAPVRDFMSVELVTVHPEVSAYDAAGKMLDESVSALPVVARGRLVGILSTTDLLEDYRARG